MEVPTNLIGIFSPDILCFDFKWSEIPAAHDSKRFTMDPINNTDVLSKTSHEISYLFGYDVDGVSEFKVEITNPELFKKINNVSDKYYEDQKINVLDEKKRLEELVDTVHKNLPIKFGLVRENKSIKVNFKVVIINIIQRQINNLELEYYLINIKELLILSHPLINNGKSMNQKNLEYINKDLSCLELMISIYTLSNFSHFEKLVYTDMSSMTEGKMFIKDYITRIRKNISPAFFILENRRRLKLDRENLSDGEAIERIEKELLEQGEGKVFEGVIKAAEDYKKLDIVISNSGEKKYGGDIDCFIEGHQHGIILCFNETMKEFEHECELQMKKRYDNMMIIMANVLNLFYKQELDIGNEKVKGLLNFLGNKRYFQKVHE